MASMHSTHAGETEHDDSVHHEGSDIDIRAIFVSAVALVVMAGFCYVAVLVTVKVLAARENQASANREYPLAVGQENRLPPEPRLQTHPKQDLKDLRAEEALILDNYRWVDRSAGVVRIPIDEAIKLTLQRGLPSRAPSAPATPETAAPATATPATPAPAAH